MIKLTGTSGYAEPESQPARNFHHDLVAQSTDGWSQWLFGPTSKLGHIGFAVRSAGRSLDRDGRGA